MAAPYLACSQLMKQRCEYKRCKCGEWCSPSILANVYMGMQPQPLREADYYDPATGKKTYLGFAASVQAAMYLRRLHLKEDLRAELKEQFPDFAEWEEALDRTHPKYIWIYFGGTLGWRWVPACECPNL